MKIYTYDNKIMTVGGKWMEHKAQPGPGPEPSLPPYTLRLRFTEGYTPTFSSGTAVQVSQSPNIWDLTYENSDWSYLLYDQYTSLLEVIGGNTTDVNNMNGMFFQCMSLTSVSLFDTSKVTDMSYMFNYCINLTTVPLFDTSKVTNMISMFETCESLTSVPLFDTSNVTSTYNMFSGCSSLTTVPLFDTSSCTMMANMFNMCSNLTTVPLLDTSKVTNMNNMFYQCYKVQTGALALYQQASTQTNPPTRHSATFNSCGEDTITGAAELAQIPSDWK